MLEVLSNNLSKEHRRKAQLQKDSYTHPLQRLRRQTFQQALYILIATFFNFYFYA